MQVFAWTLLGVVILAAISLVRAASHHLNAGLIEQSNDIIPYKEVAAEWTRRRSEYRRSTRWVWLVYWLGVAICLVPFGVGLVPLGNGVWLLVFFAAAIGFDLRQDYIRFLKCLNCGQPVVNFNVGKIAAL
jgi:hypothetical protein